MADTSDESKKSMDIHAPSDVKPSPSSRPIIVSNRSLMQDPMVKSDDAQSEGAEQAEPEKDTSKEENPKEELRSPSASKKVIQPASTAESKGDKSKDSSSEDANDPVKTTNASDDTKKEDANNAAIVDAVIGSAKKEEPRDEATADAKRKQNAEVLIDSKKFNVPIGQVTKAKKNRRLVLLSFLVLVLVLSYVMIDAGLAKVPFELPYRFFGENAVVVEQPEDQSQSQLMQQEPEDQSSNQPITYTEPSGLFSFIYPAEWSVSETSEDAVILTLYPSTEEVNATDDRLMLIRGSEEYVDKRRGELSYIKSTPIEGDTNLYLIERVYKVPTQIDGHGYFVSASVEPEEAVEQLGQETTSSGPDIEITDGQSEYVAFFYTNANTIDDNGGPGYETLEDAKAVFESEEYQIIKQILLSLKI